jgi:hypothetical protein
MFENWQGCTAEEERKKRREEKEEEEGGRESESKWQQMREASIPHFLRKMNHALSPLPIEEREKD